MTPRREMAAAVATVALGGLVVLVERGPSTALGLAAIAGAGALLLTRTRGRRWLAAGLLAVAAAVVATGWSPVRWAIVVGGALVLAGSAVVGLRAGRWPQPGERRPARPEPRREPRDAWEALDRGDDPTT
jgi:hypothetical protein